MNKLVEELLNCTKENTRIFTSDGVEVVDFFIQGEDLFIDNNTFEIGTTITSESKTLVIPKGSIVLE